MSLAPCSSQRPECAQGGLPGRPPKYTAREGSRPSPPSCKKKNKNLRTVQFHIFCDKLQANAIFAFCIARAAWVISTGLCFTFSSSFAKLRLGRIQDAIYSWQARRTAFNNKSKIPTDNFDNLLGIREHCPKHCPDQPLVF